MRNLRKIKIYILIFLLIITSFSFYIRNISLTHKNNIHVFIDCATGPMLLQAIEIISMPKSIKKIVAWNPFPHQIDNKKYNIEFLKYSKGDGWFGYAMHDALYARMREIVSNNPHVTFTFHTNIFHSRLFLNKIEEFKNYINKIHLYEDGIGNTIASRRNELEKYSFDKNTQPTDKWRLDWPYFLHLKYPTVYHFAFVDDIKNTFPKLNKLIANATILEINIEKSKKNLSKRQKQGLAHLYGIDFDKYNQLFRKSPKMLSKKGVLLLGSRPQHSNHGDYIKELNLYAQLISNDNYVYFFKPHPNPSGNRFANDLKKSFPNLEIVNSSIPAELFYILDLEPDYISGYSSSVFISIPQKQFMHYIKRNNDTYLPFLLQKGIIKPEQILDQHLSATDL